MLNLWDVESESCSVMSLRSHGLQPTRLLCPWILQVWTLEWVAMPSSRGSSQPRDWTQVFCITGGFFANWAIREGILWKKCTNECMTNITTWTHILYTEEARSKGKNLLLCFLSQYWSDTLYEEITLNHSRCSSNIICRILHPMWIKSHVWDITVSQAAKFYFLY